MKQSWKIAVAFAVVFIFGAASGAVFALRYASIHGPPRLPPRPEQFGPQLLRRWAFSRQLGLTQEQRQKIRPLILDTAEQLRRLRRDAWHNGELIIEHMQDEVAAVLTPDQRLRFDELIQAQRARMDAYARAQQQAQPPPKPKGPQPGG
jgi:Spy/CpxP family protein refolding chaperone